MNSSDIGFDNFTLQYERVNVSGDLGGLGGVGYSGEEEAAAAAASDDEAAVLFNFITNGILLNIVGLFGIFGNIVSMIILSRPQMRSSINYLLIGLARCDTVLIITSVLLFGLRAVYEQTGCFAVYSVKVFPHIAPYVFPLALIAQTVSVYLTLTVTLERFVAVCHPLRARSLCTYGRARIYVVVIIVFSTLYNLPRFLEADLSYEMVKNETVPVVIASKLRQDPIYISIYVNWFYLLLIYFLPFSCLAILNTAIYRQVRRANQERARLSRLQKKEIGLATMLLCVVVVFFFCNILALVNNIIEAFYDEVYDHLVQTSNLLVTINSSVNFIVYVTFGEKFKRLFLKLFCSPLLHLVGGSGRESPDGTHDDSVVSNGDNRNYSVRSTQMSQLHRSGTTVVRNGGASGENGHYKGNVRGGSVRVVRAPSFGPCVYYPARPTTPSECDPLQTTCFNQL